MATTTDPIDASSPQTAPRLTIAPAWTDPKTGAFYVHRDLEQATLPWAVELHIPPINRTEKFGDVDSWTAYVKRYGDPTCSLVTWSERGLRAVLDYIEVPDEGFPADPARCQWVAEHPFETHPRWRRWAGLTNGQPMGQKALIEALEDLSEDIIDPPPADVIGLLRKLRANVSSEAASEYAPDGSTVVQFKKSSTVNAGQVAIPPEIRVALPVLKGHTTTGDDGRPSAVLYELAVRIRVSVTDDAKLSFRLSMPNAERALEAAYQDRVDAAKTLLGESYQILRAAS